MRLMSVWLALAVVACAAPERVTSPSATTPARSVRNAASGTIAFCPRLASVCEVSLTGIPSPTTSGGCTVSVPFAAMKVALRNSSSGQHARIRWVIANSSEYRFARQGPNSGVVIDRNQATNGNGAFDQCGFDNAAPDSAFTCSSTHQETVDIDKPNAPGFKAYLVRKRDSVACDAEDPPIVNKD